MEIDFGAIYNFLFNTYAGVGILIAGGLVLGLVASIIMERRTRKIFKHREASESDWSFFDDDPEETEEEK